MTPKTRIVFVLALYTIVAKRFHDFYNETYTPSNSAQRFLAQRTIQL
jgi:hypothetical protein